MKLLSLQQSLQEPLLGEELAPAEVVMALNMVGDHRGSVIASSVGMVLGDPNIANRE